MNGARGRSIIDLRMGGRSPVGHVWRGIGLAFVLAAAAGCPSPASRERLIKFDDRVRFEGVDRFQGISAYRTDTGEFKFSLGLTSPIHLLSYRDAQGFPSYCRRQQILAKLEDVARGHGCEVSATDLGGAPTRLITCALQSAPSDTCPSSYVAQIWQERWPSSTEDYELDMFARVRTVCAREQDFGTFHASDEVTAAAESRSDEVTKLLAACRADPGARPGATP